VRHILLHCSPVLLGACMSYTKLGTATPVRGTEVVARLSVPLVVPLQDVTVSAVDVAAGRVAYADTDSLVLAVDRFTSATGTNYPGFGTSVTLRRDQVATLEQRHVSGGKTALLLTAGAAAIVGIVYSVGPLFGSGSGAPPGPPTTP
jgi:hypothetical protein